MVRVRSSSRVRACCFPPFVGVVRCGVHLVLQDRRREGRRARVGPARQGSGWAVRETQRYWALACCWAVGPLGGILSSERFAREIPICRSFFFLKTYTRRHALRCIHVKETDNTHPREYRSKDREQETTDPTKTTKKDPEEIRNYTQVPYLLRVHCNRNTAGSITGAGMADGRTACCRCLVLGGEEAPCQMALLSRSSHQLLRVGS